VDCLRKWSTRQARLFAVACCRRVWHLPDSPAGRRAVEVAEEVAEKKQRLTDLRVCHEATSVTDLGPDPSPVVAGAGWCSLSSPEWDFCYWLWVSPGRRRVCRHARWASTPAPWGSPDATANDARALPCHRIGLDAAKAEEPSRYGRLRDVVGPAARPVIEGSWRSRNGGAARGVAEASYETSGPLVPMSVAT
jgi:hypothetical protein